MKNIPLRQLQSALKEPHLLGNFTIRSVEALLSGKHMVQELHRHDFFYVLALEKGSGFHEIDFTSYDVCDHSVFFMRPGHVHQLTLKAGSKGFLMQFKTDFYYPQDTASTQLLRKASNKNLCQLDSKRFTKILNTLNSIFQEYTEQQEGYQEVIKAHFGIFFIELIRHRQQRNKAIHPVKPIVQERLDELIELLEHNIATFKQVSDYASRMNLTSYQLNAITKTALGKTCSELINEYILLESKRYLLATSNQINQIAHHLGYEDVSYFIRFFKKQTGVTPEVFRQNFK